MTRPAARVKAKEVVPDQTGPNAGTPGHNATPPVTQPGAGAPMPRFTEPGWSEAYLIFSIQREIDELSRYACWIRQSAEKTPWRFDKAMLAKVREARDELNRVMEATHVD